MALDPRISLGVQPLQMPDPLAQYGKVAALQQAQNQNALAQYQLGAAQRAEEKDVARTNALAQAGTDDTAIANALLKSGDLKGYSEFVKSRRETQKAELDLFDTSMKQIRDQWGRVSSVEEALALNKAAHSDPIVGRRLNQFGSSEQAAAKAILEASTNPAKFADFLKRAQLTSEKFIELNKPVLSTKDTGGTLVDRTFEPLTGKITTVGTTDKTMAPGEAERIAISRGQLGVAQAGLNLRQQELALTKNPEFQRQMEYAKTLGQNAAKGDIAAKQEFPKVVAQAEEAVNLIDQMIGKRDAKGNLVKGAAPHPGFTGSVGAGLGLRFVPGTSEANFQALYDQVKSGAFLQAFNALRGAGAITEKEGEKATAAITRMSLAQDEKEFVKAALEFQDSVKAGAARAQQKVLGIGGSVRPSAPAASSMPSVSPKIDALLDKYK